MFVKKKCRRAIATSRAVRVNSQLKSHKRFASAFQRYCLLVDHARLYSTNAVGAPPMVNLYFTALLYMMTNVVYYVFMLLVNVQSCNAFRYLFCTHCSF